MLHSEYADVDMGLLRELETELTQTQDAVMSCVGTQQDHSVELAVDG